MFTADEPASRSLRIPRESGYARGLRALVYTGPGRVEIQDVAKPTRRARRRAPRDPAWRRVCGSDIHGFLGHSERRKPGLVLGHEAVATIEEVHPSVRGLEARAARGGQSAHHLRQLCRLPGREAEPLRELEGARPRPRAGHLRGVRRPSRSCLYPFPEGLSEQEAVLTEPLANVVHYFRIAMTEVPDSLTILGAGPDRDPHAGPGQAARDRARLRRGHERGAARGGAPAAAPTPSS